MADFTTAERLTLYRLLVEQTNVIGAARRDTSRFFLTFNTAAFGGIGFGMANDEQFPRLLLAALAVGMVVVCILWFTLIRYYGRIASAKFKVILEVEQAFDTRPFALEDAEIYKPGKGGLGTTTVESSIPVLFAIGYVALAVTILLQPAA